MQLVMVDEDLRWSMPGHILLSLGRLRSLQHLEIDLEDALLGEGLTPLTGLISLRRCRLVSKEGCSLSGALPLLQLTTLTWLDANVSHGAAPGAGVPAAGLSPAASTTLAEAAAAPAASTSLAEADAAAVQLGRMSHLVTLRLGSMFVADAVIMSGLAKLTQLTRLDFWGFNLPRTVSQGHLPRLQHLALSSTDDDDYSTHLLSTLLPLLPLSSLTYIENEDGCLEVFVEAEDEESCTQEADALLQAATHLAAAPLLQLGNVSLNCGSAKIADVMVQSMQPLAGKLRDRSQMVSSVDTRHRMDWM